MSDTRPPDPPATSEASAAFDELLEQIASTPATVAHKRPGDTFGDGRYRVERLLGSGGQKVVFLA